jgi:hypothetical protein
MRNVFYAVRGTQPSEGYTIVPSRKIYKIGILKSNLLVPIISYNSHKSIYKFSKGLTNMNNQLEAKPVGLNIVLGFGKYKGQTIKDVIRVDPDYILWCVDNIEWFELDEESEKELEWAYADDDEDYSWHPAYDRLA